MCTIVHVNIFMSDFSKKLIELRKSNHLYQKDVAAGIGVSLRGYQFYESSQKEPTLSVIIALANYYNVSLDYLVGLSDDPTRH